MGETVRPIAAPSRPASRGRLLVLSGPSGVGKTVVGERILKDPRFGRAITATTRAPREGERDGVDYHFLTVEEFRRRLAAGWFLEHAEVYGRLYGTPVASVEDLRAAGLHCLLVIDVQGAATLRRQGVDALFVFLDPPSLDELARRLAGRDGARARPSSSGWRPPPPSSPRRRPSTAGWSTWRSRTPRERSRRAPG